MDDMSNFRVCIMATQTDITTKSKRQENEYTNCYNVECWIVCIGLCTPTLENLVVAHVQFHFNILIMFTLDTDKKDKFHQITNFTPTNINIIHPPIGKKENVSVCTSQLKSLCNVEFFLLAFNIRVHSCTVQRIGKQGTWKGKHLV